MTKTEFMEALSYHGWTMRNKEEMVKREHRVHVYASYSGDEYRVYYKGVGVVFRCTLSAVSISGNKLTAEWDGHKVEVRI